MDIETNNAMLRNVAEPIVRSASNFQHMSILQGTKIYGVHLHPIPCWRRLRRRRLLQIHGENGAPGAVILRPCPFDF
jgi:hypothetical protein